MLAVDLYNRSGTQRQLEAFIIHMSLAWLRLFQAKVERDGGDLYSRDPRGRRLRTKDGDWQTRPLQSLANELFDESDPRASSLEFFTGLRNKIEHRFEGDLATIVSGKTQAHMLNYERTLVEWFGHHESVSEELRFPIFVSSITEDAVEALKRVAARIPRSVKQWVYTFEADLDPKIATDQSFDFRVVLLPHTGPASKADHAMTFIPEGDLTPEQRSALDGMLTIIRDKQVPVQNSDLYMATEVARMVESAIGFRFKVNDHTDAWKHYKIRPARKSTTPEQTDAKYCVWDRVSGRHLYTNAWVKKLSKTLSDPSEFATVCGRRPTPLDPATPDKRDAVS